MVKVSVLITAGILRTDVVGRTLGQIVRDAATSKAISEKKVSWPVRTDVVLDFSFGLVCFGFRLIKSRK